MTKADWLALAGYAFLTAGLASISIRYAIPVTLLCVGIICVRLARVAAPPSDENNPPRRRFSRRPVEQE